MTYIHYCVSSYITYSTYKEYLNKFFGVYCKGAPFGNKRQLYGLQNTSPSNIFSDDALLRKPRYDLHPLSPSSHRGPGGYVEKALQTGTSLHRGSAGETRRQLIYQGL